MKGSFARFAIDDGRHRLNIVIDEDASTAAGEACYVARCSCGRSLSGWRSTRYSRRTDAGNAVPPLGFQRHWTLVPARNQEPSSKTPWSERSR